MDIEELKKRIEKYIKGMDERLKDTSSANNKVVELARLYTEDAKYYLEKGDYITALVDVVYAEGLLDAKEIYENSDPKSNVSKKVFVAGTFDILHPGHIEFLKEASKYGRVYVTVARDSNSERIKGRKPINDEQTRLEIIKSIRYVFDAILGDQEDFLKSVERINPDIIFLGPDQKVDEAKLLEELKKRGLSPQIIRLNERIRKWSHSSTTDIINEIKKRYCNLEQR
ncbi:DUF357 domain-containing protein [Saccharolobus solfataricus]|uniref:DUF357 domain-containing protein n=3 Tax=Saccharolobus solfataricus TaxID=2287 RepID=Q97ZG4_SACS2|nr:DUF357 domain-containing protein [Saccharolobus solfataricus]AAK41228.1 Conserved hypothetical protein [Saccharolobus solfataricus P2]AKA74180.1 DUF357 domain-containing protein [Saccharolobus solfataricus]AKA76878.1 DUF357 domain-containing protein [Saccharolobus solfataricus]AKA79571.1 DUF357 domain-containing protein [Saccharolobus solfataricus]AZF68660.1 DUF357 domain-containing protein [Saccharolobus solfataricus]